MATQNTNQFSKEAVRQRMLQNASNLWDVKNPLALDPFVRLLIEAFSVEVSKAANEAQNIESRILDKIARLLTPNLLTMPRTAHAIMHAKPSEAIHLLHPHTHFYTEKRMANPLTYMMTDKVDVKFTPVEKLQLIKGDVVYWAAGQHIFGADGFDGKMSLARTATALPWATCFVGIALDDAVPDWSGTSLYFNFPSFVSQPWVYQLLPLCKVLMNEHNISISGGRQYFEDTDSGNVFEKYDLMRKMTDEVKDHYDKHFITFGQCPTSISEPDNFPPMLVESFGLDVLNARLTKKVKWLQITFPPNYTYEILENLKLTLNAFPVLNRSLLSNRYSYKMLDNILPLHTTAHERFMAVHRLNDSSNRVFSEIPYNREGQSGSGYYSLRHGGAERFDERTAQDLINYLMELTRDEVAAFSSFKQDHVVTILRELTEQLQRLQLKAEKIEASIKQVPTYIVTEPYGEGDTMEAQYWVTMAAQANGIRSGTMFGVGNYPDIQPGRIYLLTATAGGRDQLQPGDRIDAYRHVLGSHDRLVTNGDIRNFCRYELGSRLKDVTFKLGLAPSDHPKQGYIRTLDIILQPQHYTVANEMEWDYLAQSLYTKIKSKTPSSVNYRMVVDKG